MKIYLTSATYFWMLCEGCYLYRLLSRAFQQPESLFGLYAFAWGLIAFTTIYSARFVAADVARGGRSFGFSSFGCPSL